MADTYDLGLTQEECRLICFGLRQVFERAKQIGDAAGVQAAALRAVAPACKELRHLIGRPSLVSAMGMTWEPAKAGEEFVGALQFQPRSFSSSLLLGLLDCATQALCEWQPEEIAALARRQAVDELGEYTKAEHVDAHTAVLLGRLKADRNAALQAISVVSEHIQ